MEEWKASYNAATAIFRFFRITEIITPRPEVNGNDFYSEGVFGRKLLCIGFPAGNNPECPTDVIGIQFRDRKSGRDRGGALIRDCKGIEFREDEGDKRVFIYSPHGYVEIDKFGVHSDLGSDFSAKS